MHRFIENVKYDVAVYPRALTTATLVSGSGVDMAKYNNFCALAGAAPSSQCGALNIFIAQSTDNSTFSATYLATASVASSTTVGFGTSVEIRAEQMSDGYRYLRVEVLPIAGTQHVIGAASLRFNSRYPQASLPA